MQFNKIKHLLAPDSLAGASEEADPFAEAAGGVDTSYPVLAANRIWKFVVKSCTRDTKHNEGSDEVKSDALVLKVALEEEGVFRGGKTALPGFSVSIRIGLLASEKFDMDSVKRGLALWMKSLLGDRAKSTTMREWINNPGLVDGLVFIGKTGIKVDKGGQYADQNTITPVLPA